MASQLSLGPEMVSILNDSATLGMGWATGRLSSLLGTHVSQAGVQTQVIPSKDLAKVLGPGGKDSVVTRMALDDPLKVTFLMVLPRGDSELIFAIVTGEKEGQASPDFLPVLAEVGNICISGYIAALADLVKLRLFPSPPETSWGGPGPEAYGGTSELLLVNAAFQARGVAFRGSILLIPDPSSAPGFLRFLRERTRVVTREATA